MQTPSRQFSDLAFLHECNRQLAVEVKIVASNVANVTGDVTVEVNRKKLIFNLWLAIRHPHFLLVQVFASQNRNLRSRALLAMLFRS